MHCSFLSKSSVIHCSLLFYHITGFRHLITPSVVHCFLLYYGLSISLKALIYKLLSVTLACHWLPSPLIALNYSLLSSNLPCLWLSTSLKAFIYPLLSATLRCHWLQAPKAHFSTFCSLLHYHIKAFRLFSVISFVLCYLTLSLAAGNILQPDEINDKAFFHHLHKKNHVYFVLCELPFYMSNVFSNYFPPSKASDRNYREH